MTDYTRQEIYNGLLLHSAVTQGFSEEYAIGNITGPSGWTGERLNEEFGQLPEMEQAKDLTEDQCWAIYAKSKS